jgi:hypothetical protein
MKFYKSLFLLACIVATPNCARRQETTPCARVSSARNRQWKVLSAQNTFIAGK